MPRKGNLWEEFNRSLCCNLPDIVVNILNECGYENELSLQQITVEHLKEIENYVQLNLRVLLNGTIYEKQNGEFKFLPGHRVLILNLPKQVEQFVAKRTKSKSRQLNATLNGIENVDVMQNRQNDENENKEDNLKDQLIAKLVKYGIKTKNRSVSDKLTTANILNLKIERDGFTYKCSVKCPVCERIVPCIYNRHWAVSNIEKHLKKHNVPLPMQNNSVELNNELNNILQITDGNTK